MLAEKAKPYIDVFDLDGTIISVNSFRCIGKILVWLLVRKGRFNDAARILKNFFLRKIGVIPHIEFKRFVVEVFETLLSEEEKSRICKNIFEGNVNKAVLKRLYESENALISTACPYAFVSRMPIKADIPIISSLDLKNRLSDEENYRQGKLANLRTFLGNPDELRIRNLYTDSYDDKALMDISENVYIVKNGSLKKLR